MVVLVAYGQAHLQRLDSAGFGQDGGGLREAEGGRRAAVEGFVERARLLQRADQHVGDVAGVVGLV